jgi:hypothetical protein
VSFDELIPIGADELIPIRVDEPIPLDMSRRSYSVVPLNISKCVIFRQILDKNLYKIDLFFEKVDIFFEYIFNKNNGNDTVVCGENNLVFVGNHQSIISKVPQYT